MKLSKYWNNSVTLAPLEINCTLMLKTKIVNGMQLDLYIFYAYICTFFYYDSNNRYLAETQEQNSDHFLDIFSTI